MNQKKSVLSNWGMSLGARNGSCSYIECGVLDEPTQSADFYPATLENEEDNKIKIPLDPYIVRFGT